MAFWTVEGSMLESVVVGPLGILEEVCRVFDIDTDRTNLMGRPFSTLTIELLILAAQINHIITGF